MSTTCKVHLALKNKTGLINVFNAKINILVCTIGTCTYIYIYTVYQEKLTCLSVTFLSKKLHAFLCISGHVQSSVWVCILYLISVEIFPTLVEYSLMSE